MTPKISSGFIAGSMLVIIALLYMSDKWASIFPSKLATPSQQWNGPLYTRYNIPILTPTVYPVLPATAANYPSTLVPTNSCGSCGTGNLFNSAPNTL